MEHYLRGELAKEAGLNFETLRYYEKINLIPAAERNKSGYRLYPKETLNRLKLIKMAQNCGFSINEIKHSFILILLTLYYTTSFIIATKPIGVSSLTESELDVELERGFADLVRGNTKPAANAFSDIRRDYGI